MTVNKDTGVSALEKVANFSSYKVSVISQNGPGLANNNCISLMLLKVYALQQLIFQALEVL